MCVVGMDTSGYVGGAGARLFFYARPWLRGGVYPSRARCQGSGDPRVESHYPVFLVSVMWPCVDLLGYFVMGPGAIVCAVLGGVMGEEGRVHGGAG